MSCICCHVLYYILVYILYNIYYIYVLYYILYHILWVYYVMFLVCFWWLALNIESFTQLIVVFIKHSLLLHYFGDLHKPTVQRTPFGLSDCHQLPLLESEVFWRWCVTHGLTGFLGFVYRPDLLKLALSEDPTECPPLLTWRRKQIQFPKLVGSIFQNSGRCARPPSPLVLSPALPLRTRVLQNTATSVTSEIWVADRKWCNFVFTLPFQEIKHSFPFRKCTKLVPYFISFFWELLLAIIFASTEIRQRQLGLNPRTSGPVLPPEFTQVDSRGIKRYVLKWHLFYFRGPLIW
jgi:hypothetical protein